MVSARTRLAVLPLGDRLVVSAFGGRRLETFVVDAAEPASALRAELDARKIRARAVAIGLARAAVITKPIELPEVAGEVSDMVRFELERHLPFPAEDAPFDFVPLPGERGVAGARAPRRVLVAAADRRVVDGALKIIQEANLKPVSVTVAVHDLVALARPSRAGRVVWVHKVETDTDLLFLEGSTIVFSRQVAAGDDGTVAGEIRRSFAITRWRGCDAVWVSGDAAAPEAPTASALSKLAVPITTPPWSRRATRMIADLPGEARGAFQLALGVASARSGRPLDLIPAALKPRRVTRAQMLTLGTGALAAGLAIGALLLPGYRDQQRLRALSADIARLEPEVRAVERVQSDLDRKKKLLATIQSLESTSIRPLPVLRELTELLPNDAWLTLLSLDAKGVELTGQAASASALIPVLADSPRLEQVEFASPVTRGRDREQFRILAKWKGGPGAATAVVVPAAKGVAAPPAPSATPTPGTARRTRGTAIESDAAVSADLGADRPRRPNRMPPEVRR